MPNHVINEVIFEGLSEETLDAILAKTVNAEGRVDFELLLPLPLNYWPGGVGLKHEKTFPGTWLDAARTTWGTKWNAYGHDAGGRYRSVDRSAGRLTLTFQTAWGPPYGWLVAIFNTFKVDFGHRWMSEGDDRGFVSFFNYAALSVLWQDAWDQSEADNETKRRLHKLLWGVEEFEPEADEA